ncbi:MAG: integration host factor subunit beta [Candidatus Electrothrix sp. AR3]|nr:integration host factor subunit beta [Candidatus Electrothrix sp. AR3]
MNKSELIEVLAQEIELPVRDTASISRTIIAAMSDALASGDSIEIRGFGSFKVKEYDAYIGRNPKSGEKISVAPKKLPFFKVGKDLREQVNAAAQGLTKG